MGFYMIYPLVTTDILLLKPWPSGNDVSVPITNGDFNHSNVEVYQRVNVCFFVFPISSINHEVINHEVPIDCPFKNMNKLYNCMNRYQKSCFIMI